ncbi:MAG: ribonuclease P [Candidatus Aramenus sp.]|jgi:ribonuclease P/MRP protein subunit POP5|nr:ribonuclease P [Candidatus Aramenus sp.]
MIIQVSYYSLLALDVVIIAWLAVLTYVTLRRHYIFTKKVKNKRNMKSKRYIIFELVVDERDRDKVDQNSINAAVRDAVKELLGRMWLEISDPKVIFFDKRSLKGIISTNRAGYKVVVASLPFAKEINGAKALIVTIRTSGSFKRAKKIMNM